MAIDLGGAMAELAARLDTIPKVQVHTSPPLRVRVPAAIVAYPESITYDTAYRRAADDMSVPVVLLVSRLNDASALAQLDAFASGAGASSVKQILESGEYETMSAVRVADAQFDVYTVAGDDYLCAVFTVLVSG